MNCFRISYLCGLLLSFVSGLAALPVDYFDRDWGVIPADRMASMLSDAELVDSDYPIIKNLIDASGGNRWEEKVRNSAHARNPQTAEAMRGTMERLREQRAGIMQKITRLTTERKLTERMHWVIVSTEARWSDAEIMAVHPVLLKQSIEDLRKDPAAHRAEYIFFGALERLIKCPAYDGLNEMKPDCIAILERIARNENHYCISNESKARFVLVELDAEIANRIYGELFERSAHARNITESSDAMPAYLQLLLARPTSDRIEQIKAIALNVSGFKHAKLRQAFFNNVRILRDSLAEKNPELCAKLDAVIHELEAMGDAGWRKQLSDMKTGLRK